MRLRSIVQTYGTPGRISSRHWQSATEVEWRLRHSLWKHEKPRKR